MTNDSNQSKQSNKSNQSNREFKFPYDTCEKSISTHTNESGHNKKPIQPFSFFVTFSTCSIIFVYIVFVLMDKPFPIQNKSKSYVLLLLTSFFVVELWHTFCHFSHLRPNQDETNKTNIQSYITHVLFYTIVISSVFALIFLVKQSDQSS